MRMTFDAADPHEIQQSSSDQVDRSRGAAKAITVSCALDGWVANDNGTPGIHRPGLEMG